MQSPISPSSPTRSPNKLTNSPNKTRAGAPIDFSFKDLQNIIDVVFEEPVGGCLAHPVLARDANVNDYLDGLMAPPEDSPSTPTSPTKTNSISVRICNNQLSSLKGLDRVMAHLLIEPAELQWLDCSCNQLTCIEDVVQRFPKLQVLYLHGNQIHSLHDVLHLARLENLQKLTLHGNPVAEKANYKLWVCAHLPKLRSLDFSSITKLDRDRVNTWYRGYLKHQEDR